MLINEVLANSFNTVVKAIIYTILVLAYLIYLSPKLVGILFGGLFLLIIASGVLRRVTTKYNN